MGRSRAAMPSSSMLATMARPVRTLGTGRVKPSVYFSPMAQPVSSSPAITSRIQLRMAPSPSSLNRPAIPP